jgi:hypothetical protein
MAVFPRPYLLLAIGIGALLGVWVDNDVPVSIEPKPRQVEAVTEQVEKNAEQGEKLEGHKDLMKDKVN